MKNKNANRRGDASPIRFLLILTAVVALVFTGARIQAAPGDLDGSFGNGGVVITDSNFGGSVDYARDLAIQPDGKILVVGGSGCRVLRYNANGTLDLSFDGDGMLVSCNGYAMSVALQADGRILLLSSVGVYRLNSDGSPDAGFGGAGLASVPFDAPSELLVQPDGKVVVVGTTQQGPLSRFAVARFNNDGNLDTSFDGDGRLISIAAAGTNASATSVALDADGKLVVAGYAFFDGSDSPPPRSGYDFVVVRYNSDGTLDTSFGTDGWTRTDASGDEDNFTDEQAYSLVIQPDGRIVLAGSGPLYDFTADYVVVRYNNDGTLDTSFSDDGMVRIGVAPNNARDVTSIAGTMGLALQANGKLIIAGTSDMGYDGTQYQYNMYDSSIVRLNMDGSLDTTFDMDGKATIDVSPVHRDDGFSAIAIRPDGRICIAGNVSSGPYNNNLDFSLVCYLGDPTNRVPICSGVVTDISVLATPNHTLQLITLSGATDPDGDALTLTITGVTQDEPVNGQGDGDASPDAASGPVSNQVYIRGERSGKGDGRVYRIAFTISDDKGGTCSGTGIGDGTVNVSVPRNQSGVAAVDSGEAFNSFGP